MRTALCILALFLMALPTYSGDYVSGSATCPSSGAAHVSPTSYQLYQVTVQALSTNGGIIYLGGSTVTSATGVSLTPGASYNSQKTNTGVNPSTMYFACSVNTDGLTWIGSR